MAMNFEIDDVPAEIGSPGFLKIYLSGDDKRTFIWCWYGYDDEIADRLDADDCGGLAKYIRSGKGGEVVAYLAMMEVRPALGGRGIGSALISAAMEFLAERGVDSIFLHRSAVSRSSDALLKKFYTKNGFSDVRCCVNDSGKVMRAVP
jgi:ribosomal protein S18 acetylase RimI-like enzyme